jgi:hypothetical protein
MCVFAVVADRLCVKKNDFLIKVSSVVRRYDIVGARNVILIR